MGKLTNFHVESYGRKGIGWLCQNILVALHLPSLWFGRSPVFVQGRSSGFDSGQVSSPWPIYHNTLCRHNINL